MRERGDRGDGYYVRKSQLNLSYPVGGIRHGSSTLLLSCGKHGFKGSGQVRGTGISHDGSRNLVFFHLVA